jgi:hypothetical protein
MKKTIENDLKRDENELDKIMLCARPCQSKRGIVHQNLERRLRRFVRDFLLGSCARKKTNVNHAWASLFFS